MRGSRRSWVVGAVAAMFVVRLAPVASAADPSVSLSASRTRLTFGQSTVLSGKISPAPAGEIVKIVDGNGKVRGQDETNAAGEYEVTLWPRRNMRFRADWDGTTSDPVRVLVRPIVSVSLRGVRLFMGARVTGSVRPAQSGRVLLQLKRNGRLERSKRVFMSDGRFKAKFGIRKPGSHRVVAVFDGPDHLPGRGRSALSSPAMPSLSKGSRSIYVRALEGRLRDLGYRLLGVDRTYTHTTADAVRAFNKVQRRERLGSVSESTWRALASPTRPRPRSSTPRYHIEVDQTKQVLYRVRRGRVITILHVSTGASGATHDGRYTFFRRVNGYSPNRLYYPVYFDGLRAIHGWPSVPTYPASHGCVRVPMWAAKWLSRKVELGHKIVIYH
ncbi:MAG: L,D-transpeptidase family protein [Actinobacteria bacterium]|nr:L,D-transpeptidase family protein [Actinomycetota bacterium]